MAGRYDNKERAKAWLIFEVLLFFIIILWDFLGYTFLSIKIQSFLSNILNNSDKVIVSLKDLTVENYFTYPFTEMVGFIVFTVFNVFAYFIQFFYFAYSNIFGVEDGHVRSRKDEHGKQRWSTFSEMQNSSDTAEILLDKNGDIIQVKLPSNHNTRRWLENEKIKSFTLEVDELYKLETLGVGGMVFTMVPESNFSDKQKSYMDISDSNKVILGVSRSGKGRRNILVNIPINGQLGNSMFIHDPKGELYNATGGYLESLGYKLFYFNFKSSDVIDGKEVSGLARSDCFNPLNYIYKIYWEFGLDDSASDLLEEMAHTLFYEKNSKEYFVNTSKSMFKAMAWMLLLTKQKSLFNIPTIYALIGEFSLLYSDEERDNFLLKFINNSGTASDYNVQAIRAHFEPASAAAGSPETMSNVMSSVTASLSKWATSSGLRRLLSRSDFEFSDLINKKVAVFVVTPDGGSVGDNLTVMMIDQIYSALTMSADSNGGELDRQFNFLLDEFGNFPKIPDFDSKLTLCLGRNIRFYLYIQSLSQLETKYEKVYTETILDNCQTMQYLKSTNIATNKKVSEKLGSFTIEKTSIDSKGKDGTTSTAKRSLLTPTEVGQITNDESVTIRTTIDEVKYPERFPLPDLSVHNISKKLGMSASDPRLPSKEKYRVPTLPLEYFENYAENPDGAYEEMQAIDLYAKEETETEASSIDKGKDEVEGTDEVSVKKESNPTSNKPIPPKKSKPKPEEKTYSMINGDFDLDWQNKRLQISKEEEALESGDSAISDEIEGSNLALNVGQTVKEYYEDLVMLYMKATRDKLLKEGE